MAVTEFDLIVEDGTGVTDANTYVTRLYAVEYHRLRDNTLFWDAGENNQVASLIRASQYMDQRWVWAGAELVDGQGLGFPRDEIYDRYGNDVSESVPREIMDACCEYALAVIGDGTGTVHLSPNPDQSTPLSVSLQRDKVGSLETETRYNTSTGPRVQYSYPLADRIIRLSGFAINTSGGRTIR